MYTTKKEIDKWIKLLNSEQVEMLRLDNYLDKIYDEDLDGCERFRGGKINHWNLWFQKHSLSTPRMGKQNGREVDLLINDDVEGNFESE